MKRILLAFSVLFMILCNGMLYAKEVAITIDDLPFVGNAGNTPGNLRRETERFMLVVNALKKNNIPVTGFAIGEAVWGGSQIELLKIFKQNGNLVGNHTYTHPNLNRMSAKKYIAQIAKTDKVLIPVTIGSQKYFRYPYLAEGNSPEKYYAVRKFLEANEYIVAPVTIDSKDWRFNARLLHINWRVRKEHLNSIRRRYLNYLSHQVDKEEREAMATMHRPIKQILLIHMNYLNAYSIDDIINLFKSKGYTFISLKDALTDPYYKKYNHRYAKYKKRYENLAQQKIN